MQPENARSKICLMGMTTYRRRVVAWIASFAVLLASLAPSVSHALVAAGLSAGSPSVSQQLPIAKSPRGMPHNGDLSHSHPSHLSHDSHGSYPSHAGHADPGEPVPPNAEGDLSNAHGSHTPDLHFEHCPFCFTHAGSFGLSPTNALMLPMVRGTTAMPSLFYQSPAPLQVWVTAQSRAPPVTA
ncbi:MAG: hypothetical protein JWR21_4278 [Herminiimonas sp.]|nr:hypothetical protein [Herminiimonas sp.]